MCIEAINGQNISIMYVLALPHMCVTMVTVLHAPPQVQSRVNHKPPVVRKLDDKLQAIGRELGVRFGGMELSYDFLTDSSEYFTKASHMTCHMTVAGTARN